MNEQISPQAFNELLSKEDSLLLDVRTKAELDKFGIISSNQTHIDVYSETALLEFLNLPKDKTILVYCFHGNRSRMVCNILAEEGFLHVVDLAGGIVAWSDADFSLVTK